MDSITNVSGAITEIVYLGIVIWNMLLQRVIPSIPFDVLDKVTRRFNNSSIFGITRMFCNKHK